jgi:integrating conjugative element protein (TIGR03752 family)
MKNFPLSKFNTLTLIFLSMIAGINISACSHKSTNTPTASFIKDSASSDTPVETLKTLSSEIAAVEQQNRDLVSQNRMLIEQDKNTLGEFKKDMLAKVDDEINQAKAQFQQMNTNTDKEKNTNSEENKNSVEVKNTLNNSLSELQNNKSLKLNENNSEDANSQLTWVPDLQKTSSSTCSQNRFQEGGSHSLAALINPAINEEHKNGSHHSGCQYSDNTFPNSNISENTSGADILNPLKNNSEALLNARTIPFYTIPVNATLTGAIAMQPLIGRVPIDGKVPDPYTFKAIIGAKNLAANGVDIPSNIQGIVVSGIAEGDMLGECARGEITSMTFVFQDGRISTTQAKDNQFLGTIAAANGNPCIAGSFHSDAALFLGASAGLSGIQAYGNALSQSQLSNVSSSQTGSTISSLIGSADKYAFGQGFSASSQAAQKWWNQRVQNSFDFVYVPNVDLRTGKKLALNINITQEIPIDYDPKARKLFYANDKLSDVADKLD